MICAFNCEVMATSGSHHLHSARRWFLRSTISLITAGYACDQAVWSCPRPKSSLKGAGTAPKLIQKRMKFMAV
ncbi:hypothetical protein AOLI_G00212190 [Acnodon oligacanthus]